MLVKLLILCPYLYSDVNSNLHLNCLVGMLALHPLAPHCGLVGLRRYISLKIAGTYMIKSQVHIIKNRGPVAFVLCEYL